MKIRSVIRVILLSFMVFLTGCGVRHYEIPHGLTPDKVSENESIVILSTGAKSSSFEDSCSLMMRRVEDGKFALGVVVNNPTVKSHFVDHHGFLHILRFKPGKYFFALHPTAPFTLYGKPSSVIIFEVKQNEIVYIGEVFVEYVKTPWTLRGKVTLTINDKFERDVGIFLEKNPSFKLENIKKRMPYSIRLEDKEKTEGE